MFERRFRTLNLVYCRQYVFDPARHQTDIGLSSPGAIVVEVGNGVDIFVADRGNKRVQRFRSDCALGETVVGGDGVLEEPSGMCMDGDKNLYVADAPRHHVLCFGPVFD